MTTCICFFCNFDSLKSAIPKAPVAAKKIIAHKLRSEVKNNNEMRLRNEKRMKGSDQNPYLEAFRNNGINGSCIFSISFLINCGKSFTEMSPSLHSYFYPSLRLKDRKDECHKCFVCFIMSWNIKIATKNPQIGKKRPPSPLTCHKKINKNVAFVTLDKLALQ